MSEYLESNDDYDFKCNLLHTGVYIAILKVNREYIVLYWYDPFSTKKSFCECAHRSCCDSFTLTDYQPRSRQCISVSGVNCVVLFAVNDFCNEHETAWKRNL